MLRLFSLLLGYFRLLKMGKFRYTMGVIGESTHRRFYAHRSTASTEQNTAQLTR